MKNRSLNRVLAMLLCIVVLIGSVPISVSAVDYSYVAEVGEVTLDLSAAEAADGYYTVTVPINLTANSGLISLMLDIAYDENIDLVAWTEGEVYPYVEGTIEEGLVDSEISKYNHTSTQEVDFEQNPFRIYYADATSLVNNTTTGTLINLIFNVPADIAAGEYPIRSYREQRVSFTR